ncbi:unnamed protein product [Owenia fusiformis]|uniref:Anion exchange protein n=1 Tax=Owenia fusiformis TaxID=6347 RepID=A0A8J1Y5K7_OWEFU|nr:unnamed protein product [Owenia fusiformis]
MAAFESILAGAVCGCTYHLFSGQPLTIIGSTGPILVFETIAFSFCSDNGLDYLSFRFWIGTWTGVILLIMVAFDLSSLVRFITRFTEESFAALIALIFIYEAFSKLIKLEKQAHINFHALEPMNLECYCAAKNETHANDTSPVSTTPISPNTTNASYVDDYANVQWKLLPLELCEEYNGVLEGPGCKTPKYVADVFFFSCLLFLGTFFLAYSLKLFRNTRFFPNKVRVLISDFAVFLAIIAMVGLDIGMGFNTPKLTVPSEFRPTKEGRSWFVNPMKNPWWAIPAAILPALLCTILIFMDQQITAVIVNRKENKLKKGSGYHLDLFIIALQIVFCSMMGLPWFVAATVLSINHVNSLKIESETTAPGEKPQFLGVREQRVTGFCIFLFIGISILLTSILKYVPMPVLFGVFLYMGISSLKGVQFVQRLLIILMPTKYQPDYIFLRHVPVRRVHLFTLIQAVCLAILWTIKSIKSISIIFPLMVLAMCFVRKAMDWLFTQHDLKWLDDVMPETHKREKEDKKKKQIEALEKGEADELEMMGGTIQVPLQGGRLVNIPVDQIKYNPAKATVNISEEMAKTAIWKTLVSNESNPNIQDLDNNKPRKRKKKSKRKDAPGTIVEQEEPSPTKAPVKFSMGAEETEALIEYPEIRVSPPSEATTPNKESSNQEQTKL